MNGVSAREKGLLIGAAVVVLVTVYFVARVQPQRARVKSLTEETANLEKKVAAIALPKNSGDPEAVNKQWAEVNARFGKAREELDAVFSKRVDETSNQALEGLMLEILTLASAKGVSVDTSGVYAGSIADFGIAAKEELARLQAGGGPFRFRPLRSLSLRGGYPHIQNFIKELPKLGHEVNVLRFSLKVDGDKSQDPQNSSQPRVLRAELVLAL